MTMAKKLGLSSAKAKAEIKSILKTVSGVTKDAMKPISRLKGGKLYELYVLSQLLKELSQRHFQPKFIGPKIKLKASPGEIDLSDPHFELRRRPGVQPEFRIFTDIQVRTLGASTLPLVTDYSGYHEIDLVVLSNEATNGKPRHDQMALGVECKGTVNFEKSFVREVLGRRRELSFLTRETPCKLDGSLRLRADPASEYWLIYLDPAGDNYKQSPEVFEVLLKNWRP